MTTTIAKPAKLTEALIDEYLSECEKLEAAKKDLKPLTDKTNGLYDQIEKAFLAAGSDRKRCGRYLLAKLKKRGSVPWKAELVKRLSSEELAKIEAAAPEKIEVSITIA